ncbi:unnamed protein product [Lymnaea stagnalis]|uniref:Uncharacterized protein n=1 Tax=Lymnaea stagnalis TaxID=6523 RepID=A0AAV2HAU2_LYMST
MCRCRKKRNDDYLPHSMLRPAFHGIILKFHKQVCYDINFRLVLLIQCGGCHYPGACKRNEICLSILMTLTTSQDFCKNVDDYSHTFRTRSPGFICDDSAQCIDGCCMKQGLYNLRYITICSNPKLFKKNSFQVCVAKKRN